MGKFLILHPKISCIDQVLEKASFQNEKNGPFDSVILLGDGVPHGFKPAKKVEPLTYFHQNPRKISEVKDEDSNTIENTVVSIEDNFKAIQTETVYSIIVNGFKVMFVSENATHETIKNIQLSKCDILITFYWAETIAAQEKLMLVGSSIVDHIVKETKPRYHFAVGSEVGKFYESDAFSWKEAPESITRFISLGQFGSGEKWFYAFSIEKEIDNNANVMLGKNPFETNVNNSILSWNNDANQSNKRKAEVEPHYENKREDIKPKIAKVVSPQNCFFCLSNSKVELHMIASVGKYCYIAVAKGPLTKPNKSIPFSGHAIIIPIAHVATLREDGKDITETDSYGEMIKYQDSLVEAYSVGAPDLRLIFFSIDRAENVHAHWQFLPVPVSSLENFESALEETVILNNEKYVRNQKIEFQKFNEMNQELKDLLNRYDNISFTICHGGAKTWYIAKLSEGRIDLQFPRRVLANLLHIKKRVYWEKCKQPMKIEMLECQNFKNFYKDYDFTL